MRAARGAPSAIVHRGCTVAVQLFTGYSFRPSSDNVYVRVDTEDDDQPARSGTATTTAAASPREDEFGMRDGMQTRRVGGASSSSSGAPSSASTSHPATLAMAP